MKQRRGLALLAAGIGLLAAGCIDLEYVGQEFEPTPMSRPVVFFQNRTEIPPGEYRIIGRAILTAPDGTLGYDIQEKLLNTAREAGADAVCLVSSKQVKVGTYTIENSSFSPPGSVRLNPGNLSADGRPIEINTFGSRMSSVRGEERSRIEIVVKALYLKNRAEVARILAERGRELEELESEGGEPSLAPAPKAADSAGKADAKAEEAAPDSSAGKTEVKAEEAAPDSSAGKTEEKAKETVPAPSDNAEAKPGDKAEETIPALSPGEGSGKRAEPVPAAPAAIPENPSKAVNSVSAKE